MEEITREQEDVIRKIEKLLRLASNNPNEAEASSAAEKAQALLEAYNLDMVTIEKHKPQGGGRDDKRLNGGLYKWQREIWKNVAELNFCMYWSDKGLTKGSKYEHRVVGRSVNILSTKMMASYLEQAIERLAREWVGMDGTKFFVKATIAYREGMADRVAQRIQSRRYEMRREADRKAKEQAGDPNSTALTIRDVESSEYDDNMEFLHPGYKARKAKEKEEAARWDAIWKERREKALAEAEKFEREHPEEAAKLAAEKEKARIKAEKEWARKNARRKGRTYKEPKVRHESYYDGYDKGGDISLDQQIDRQNRKEIR